MEIKPEFTISSVQSIGTAFARTIKTRTSDELELLNIELREINSCINNKVTNWLQNYCLNFKTNKADSILKNLVYEPLSAYTRLFQLWNYFEGFSEFHKILKVVATNQVDLQEMCKNLYMPSKFKTPKSKKVTMKFLSLDKFFEWYIGFIRTDSNYNPVKEGDRVYVIRRNIDNDISVVYDRIWYLITNESFPAFCKTSNASNDVRAVFFVKKEDAYEYLNSINAEIREKIERQISELTDKLRSIIDFADGYDDQDAYQAFEDTGLPLSVHFSGKCMETVSND